MRKLFKALDRKLVEQNTDANKLKAHRALVEKILEMHEALEEQHKLVFEHSKWRELEPKASAMIKLDEHFKAKLTGKIRNEVVGEMNDKMAEHMKQDDMLKKMIIDYENFLTENIPKLLKPKKEN